MVEMEAMTPEPDSSYDPFWNYSLMVYQRVGVADACIRLQDQYGLDVNVVLFCVWCGVEGPGRLDRSRLSASVEATRDWQRRAVVPLRGLRRHLKENPGPLDAALVEAVRKSVAAAELEAEHAEQILLSRAIADLDQSARDEGAAVDAAIANLASYLRLQKVAMDPALVDDLEAVLAGCIRGAEITDLAGRLHRPA
jgi:uncharacterized protein (TIGR02444 family)